MKINKILSKMILILGVLMLFSGLPILAEEIPLNRLLKAKTLKCVFEMGVTALWENGGYKLQQDKFSLSEKDSTTFIDSIDLTKGTARLIGNQGASDVIVIKTDAGLTFVEKATSGNLMFLTVFADYKNEKNDEFICVYSRHVGSFIKSSKLGPTPSQYHGTCKIWK